MQRSGFVSGSVVNWNGAALANAFVNNSQLTASVPASNLAKIATAFVTVVNPVPYRVYQELSSVQLLKQALGPVSRSQHGELRAGQTDR